MIADYLLTGKENARTGSDLAKLCGCDPREITAQIEKERRAGKPICASCDPEKPVMGTHRIVAVSSLSRPFGIYRPTWCRGKIKKKSKREANTI